MLQTLEIGDLERLLDRHALEEGLIREDEVFEAVATAMDGDRDQFGPKLTRTLQMLLRVRVADPQAFDVLALKLLCPGMSQDDLTVAMNAMGRAKWGHRARCCEKVGTMIDRFPQLAGVLVFDRRGGKRVRTVTDRQLAEEYAALKAAERAKPPRERTPCEGENGLYARLAEKHGMKGLFGRASWTAVYKRIYRVQKKKTRQSRYKCPETRVHRQ